MCFGLLWLFEDLRMGQMKREIERLDSLQGSATAAAKEARALKECEFPGHSDNLLSTWDDDANKRAYAIGTNWWKAGEVDGTREEFMAAIKEAIDMAPDHCPDCDRMGRD